MSDLEGVMLSDYLLLQCVSEGGIADIYRARQTAEGNYEVAVKVFRPGYAQHAAFRDHFMAEAEKIGRFDHPNILPLLEFGEGEGLLYAVTPYVISGTLENLLARVGGKFSAMQALPIMQQLCSAVQYAHNHTVIHGNIKPSNVFVAADGRMLLSDFGIARGYDDSQQSLTHVGWSSAEYAAPEQSLGVLRPASDIYTLGILLFRMLTGIAPFTGQTPVEVLLKHVREQPPSARSLVPTISDAVDCVLLTALQKRSDDRFASAEEFSNAFLAAVTVAPVASPVAKSVVTKSLQHAHAQLVPMDNPQTPVSAALPVGNLSTPIPAPFALSSSASSNRKTIPLSLPDEETNQPVLPTMNASGGGTGADMGDSAEQLATFSSDQMRIGKHRFWSVDTDPVEWSPVTSTPIDSVPLTANAYLSTKPLVPVELPSTSEPGLPTRAKENSDAKPLRVEKRNDAKPRSFSRTFQKALPIIVVILLLLGLLGALLSSFYFPSDDHGAYTQPEHAISGIALTAPQDGASSHMIYSHN